MPEGLVWLHNAADLMIWIAYVAIPLALAHFVSKRRSVPFNWIFWMFAAFIVSCGFTHFIEFVTYSVPVYRLSGLIKIETAIVSWATVLALIPLIPKALALRSPEEMQKEIEQRKKAEEDLQAVHADLERRVSKRTRELADANGRLQSEINERLKIEAMLKSAAQQLLERNTELDRSNKDLDEFANIASHDMKEPLRGIHNYSHFLLTDYGDRLDEEGKAKLKTLTRLSQHLEKLIESLLHYSQVGRLDLAIVETDLNRILDGILDSSRIFLEEQGAKVSIPRPLPTLKCDQARVGEIFLNLIVNAAKYNDKPEKSIEIGYERKPRSGVAGAEEGGDVQDGETVFYVRDNGIGIREKYLETIFGIFKRLHARDKYGGGTGLGLSIVKRIVERHGGRVWVESTPGEGSAFYFTLGQGVHEPQLEAHTAC